MTAPAKTLFQVYQLYTLATLPGFDVKVVHQNLATVPGRTSDGRIRGEREGGRG